MTEYHTLQELQELAVQQKKEIWQIVQQEDMDASERTKLSGKPAGLVPPLSFSKRSVWR